MSTVYSVEVPNAPTISGEGKPRRHPLFVDKLLEHPPEVITLWENFLHGLKESGGGNFLGHRPIENGVAQPYVWQTYPEVKTRVISLGSGLRKLGLKPLAPLGILMLNCPEWTITELASYMHNFITVPLYETLGVEAIDHIVNETDMEYVVTSQTKARYLLDMKTSLPTLHTIIVADHLDQDTIDYGKSLNVQVVDFLKVEDEGSRNQVKPETVKPSDIATICYTSGTTGRPKGAVLTNSNIVSLIAGITAMGEKGKLFKISKDDVHVSYLPLAHVYERCNQGVMIYSGASIGFYQGDTLKLLDDIAELKPTLFISVPRLLNRVYDKVMAGVKAKGGVAEWTFNTAYNQKKALLSRGIINHWLWDRVVFTPIRARLGGRVRAMLSGSAPISPDVMDFLRICFSAEVYEGFGQTENAACITMSHYGDTKAGHVGGPQPTVEVKLVDVPDMNYTSQDVPLPRGEICVRGYTVFREYYKNPEKTNETLDKNGWCHTGDIGLWDSQGRLIIIDRLKNIFKLAQGEYIAPEKIELIYQKHELVAQAYVHGDSLQASLVGVIVPDNEVLTRWAKENGFEDKSFKELCEEPKVKNHILQTLAKYGKAHDLKGFENIKNIYLSPEPFSAENDLLTPTFKLKRHQAQKHFTRQIETMYFEIS
ncbi:13126_t:CDS:2 [Ambispora gerdemannii]|uniref:Long-chain-fatty-acid--CoA ligase n=1 Tax=Ambispora gerdemannii TaxID=144530 RepID=A0A9N9FJK8_9GLOM|nr:13126_t:CDS:2 [Ambispora gerdemannii]